MQKANLDKLDVPDTPGVYFFLSEKREILYIGKATSLRNRVRSYFSSDIIEKRSVLIYNMVSEAATVEWTETGSVLEAMILEANLIRTHKPRANTRSKDDKSYNHVIITEEEWPRLLVVRGKDLTEKFADNEIAHTFGPFPNGQLLREALKIVRRIFKFYDTKRPLGEERSKVTKGKIDFNRQIGLYPHTQSRETYLKTIRHLELFFSGKKEELLAELEKDMMRYAKEEQFEEASRIKKQMFALTHIQDVALLKDDARIYRDEKRFRIEAYDVAHLQGEDMVGVMTVMESGIPAKHEYRKFKIKQYTKANDPGALREMITRRLTHDEWPTPQLIVVDGNQVQKGVVETVLQEAGRSLPVVGVVKDATHKPKAIIGSQELINKHKDIILMANAEAHRFAIEFHKKRRRKGFIA
jgi:excinuclease UvrABC nuclease subunit